MSLLFVTSALVSFVCGISTRSMTNTLSSMEFDENLWQMVLASQDPDTSNCEED